jgi:hypothetical protein
MLLLKYDLHLPNCTTQVIVNNNIQKNFPWKTHISEIFLFLYFIKKYLNWESDLALTAIGYLKNSFAQYDALIKCIMPDGKGKVWWRMT